ncbi:MAG: hypothetical protein JO004_14385 [Methylobacteriaceae bacterium]|nr:hypothetical protein [Methylobacteriaceae bacterium]
MAIDWEKPCGSQMKYEQIRDFVQMFADRLGFYPMIYGGHAIRESKQLRDGDALFAKCPIWYQSSTLTPAKLPTRTWAAYTLWQYDDEHRKNGAPPPHVLNGVDWSRFNGTFEQLKNEWPFAGPV